MMFRALKFALPLALVVSTAYAAPEPTVLDRSAAMKAPVEDLARVALAATVSRFVEVERPTFTGFGGPEAPLRGLRFATAATMAGNPGLCEATTAWINVGSDSKPIETAMVYKIVGDLAPLPDMWNEAYEAELTRKCSEAGRVIPSENTNFGQTTFFAISKGGEDYVWRASRALQLAIAGAKSGSPVVCVPAPGIDTETLREMAADYPEAVEDRDSQKGCAQAAATLADLSLDRVLRMDIAPCPMAEENVYCLSALFLRFAYFNRQALWEVTLRYQEGEGDNRDVVSVSGTTLRPSSIIYD